MREIPNCKICKLKCCGCESYYTCNMRKGLNDWTIDNCTHMASKYYLFDKYLDSPNMALCKYENECQSVVEAWLYGCN